MGYLLTEAQADSLIEKLRDKYEIWAPVLFPGTGRFSETDVVRYDAVKKARDVVFDKKSDYSFKAAILPPNTTMFYFTEDSVTVPAVPEKDRLVFVRSCDMNAVRRLDQIYLNNKFADSYYAAMREKVHFVLMGCPQSFENCFCVSMGTNTCEGYGAYVTPRDGGWYFDCSDPDVRAAVEELGAETREEAVEYVTENEVRVTVPDNLSPKVRKSHVWDEYDKRCIGCGRCNFACPTCTCFTTQDIFYKDNARVGERRRVYASCMVDGYTDIAGNMSFRNKQGERMRFKVMHKVYDFKDRFGYQMCVGCGRCDDICPEYISFSACVNKLGDAMKEVEANEE